MSSDACCTHQFPARWPSKDWPRGAILVSTSNASSHSCTPLSSRINDPRTVFSTLYVNIAPLFPDERRAHDCRVITWNKRYMPPTVRRCGNENMETRCSTVLPTGSFVPHKFRLTSISTMFIISLVIISRIVRYVCPSMDARFYSVRKSSAKIVATEWRRDRLFDRCCSYAYELTA